MANLPTGVTVSKIPITSLIMIFVVYIVIHIIIAVVYKQKKEDLDNINVKDDMTEDEKEIYGSLFNTVKWLGFAYKWFPAFVIILILIGFYF